MAYENLNWAAKTDVGRRRKNNEDAVVGLPARGIFCVADGMGGMAAGEMASKLVVTTLAQILDCDTPPASAGDRARRVMEAISVANERIIEATEAKGRASAGSTVVVLAFDGRNPARAAIVHAGDSRCYRFRRGELQQLTTDHSVAQAVGVEEKRLSAIFRGVVTRAVGTMENVNPERTNVAVEPGDLFLVCSDGLNRMLPDSRIGELLNETAEQPLAARVDALVEAANTAGGDDNVTCLLVEVGAWKPEDVLPGSESDETLSDTQPTAIITDAIERGETRRVDKSSAASAVPPEVRTRNLILTALLALIVTGGLLWLFM